MCDTVWACVLCAAACQVLLPGEAGCSEQIKALGFFQGLGRGGGGGGGVYALPLSWLAAFDQPWVILIPA